MTARWVLLGMFGVFTVALSATTGHGQGAAELEKLLDQALRVEAKRARPLVQRMLKALEEDGTNLSHIEREKLTSKLAQSLKKSIRTPAELRAVLGEKATWMIARQVSFRRYQETWLVETPVRVVVTFDCRQGEEPRLVAARPIVTP